MALARKLLQIMVSACLLLAALPSLGAAADIPDDLRLRLLGITGDAGSSRSSTAMSAGGVQVDNSIDEDRYFVGMGDVFDIAVADIPSIGYHAEVNQNCDIVVADLGIVKLGKRPLRQAKAALTEFVKQKLRQHNTVYVSLARGKSATVSVTGAVANPGTYSLSGALRVLDAVRAANNNQLPALSEFDYRCLECHNGDSLRTLDLFQYIFAGADTANPYLYPGDHIVLRKASRRAYLFGQVLFPLQDAFPIRQDETLADILRLFPPKASADTSRVSIQSGRCDSSRQQTFVSAANAASVLIDDQDIITVAQLSDYPRVSVAATRGEVLQPGAYPIVPGKTTARELLALCGGATPEGDISRAVLIRNSKLVSRSLTEGAAVSGAPTAQKSDVNVAVVRPEINNGFQKMNILNDYIVISLRDQGLDTRLLSEDHIIVPRKEGQVYLSGDVERPGAYPFVAGSGVRHYVHLAGGYTNRAARTNVFVVSQYGPSVLMKSGGVVDDGDIIVVPDREETKFLRTLFLPILTAIATTVAAIVALLTVAHN